MICFNSKVRVSKNEIIRYFNILLPPSPTPSTPLGKGVYPVIQGVKGCSLTVSSHFDKWVKGLIERSGDR